MRFGIMQSALDTADLARSFQLARQAGGEGIEITCDRNEDLATLLGKEGPDLITGLKKKHKLEVPSIGLGILRRDESLFGPPATVTQARNIISKAIAVAVEVEAKIVLVPFFGKATIEFEEEFGRVLDALGDPAEEAEAAGVTLGIESTLNVNQQRHMLDHLGAYSSVKVYYDTGNTLSRKWDPATYLRDLGRDGICQTHFKDVRLSEEGDPPDWNVALGAGHVDFPAVANALAAMGFDGWIILETPPTDDPVAAAKANLQFARDLIG